jgi:hypothetical protein
MRAIQRTQASTLLLLLFLCTCAIHIAAQGPSTLLDQGAPIDGQVAVQGAQYYKINLPVPFPDSIEGVTINVTPIGDGNPDCEYLEPHIEGRQRQSAR